jgi:translation initiation factor 1
MRLFAGTPWDRPPTCDRCGKLASDCRCPPLPPARLPPHEQTARVVVQKRKNAKVVTVVEGLSPAESDLAALLTHLKTHCGAGGTLKDHTLEIQGEHHERVQSLLAEMGYRLRR